jgi:addiction module HigA family antidote
MIQHNAPHPGSILKYEIEGTGKTITEVAEGLGISRKVLSQILNGRAGVTAEMAMRFAKAFHKSPELWVNLQKNYELSKALRETDVSKVKEFERKEELVEA